MAQIDYLCKCCHQQFRKFCGDNLKTGLFINCMRAFVCFLNVCPMYTGSYEMIEYMPNEMDKFIYKFLLNFFCISALLSYWTASLRQPKDIPQITIQQSMNSSSTTCHTCRGWKPDRAHHCHFCGRCTPKMDHHCPWIGNCVGYHNLKPFFLFCFYQACSGVVYFCMLMNRCFYAPKNVGPMSFWGAFGYWVTNILDMPICFALLGLSTNIFFQIYDNVTTLETTGRFGHVVRRFPLCGIVNKFKNVQPNQFDVLWPNNLRQVFGPTIILWGVPFYQPEMAGQGFYFPKLPNLETKDWGILQRDGQSQKKQRNYNAQDQFASDVEEYTKKACDKYDGYRFYIPTEDGQQPKTMIVTAQPIMDLQGLDD